MMDAFIAREYDYIRSVDALLEESRALRIKSAEMRQALKTKRGEQ